jgi:hypothetical protein
MHQLLSSVPPKRRFYKTHTAPHPRRRHSSRLNNTLAVSVTLRLGGKVCWGRVGLQFVGRPIPSQSASWPGMWEFVLYVWMDGEMCSLCCDAAVRWPIQDSLPRVKQIPFFFLKSSFWRAATGNFSTKNKLKQMSWYCNYGNSCNSKDKLSSFCGIYLNRIWPRALTCYCMIVDFDTWALWITCGNELWIILKLLGAGIAQLA